MHGGSYTSFPEARQKRQEQLGDALKRWNDEERRLFHHMKIMKQRAAQNFKNATKANGAETRWEKFVAAGPPPPPVPDQNIYVNLRGADSARRVVVLDQVGIGSLFQPFSDEVHFGERLGLIGLMLNYGTVYIRVGEATFTFDDVFNPSEVQRELFHRISQRNIKERQAQGEAERQRMVAFDLLGQFAQDGIAHAEDLPGDAVAGVGLAGLRGAGQASDEGGGREAAKQDAPAEHAAL